MQREKRKRTKIFLSPHRKVTTCFTPLIPVFDEFSKKIYFTEIFPLCLFGSFVPLPLIHSKCEKHNGNVDATDGNR